MEFNGLRLECAFEGTSNFVVVLDENGLLEYIKTSIEKPQAYDAQNLSYWKKYVAKARRIILEGV